MPRFLQRLLGGTISSKVLLSLLAIYLATYTATAIVVFSNVRASIVESNSDALHEMAQRRYERLDSMFRTLETNLTAWSQSEVMNDLLSDDMDKRISQALERDKKLYSLEGDIYAFDRAGRLIASTRRSRPFTRLPEIWKRESNGLVFLDKHEDPAGDGEVVALEMPVHALFETSLKTGLLVLTSPWSRVEGLVMSPGSATVLRRIGRDEEILGVDWRALAGTAPKTELPTILKGEEADVISGRSDPGTGLIHNWQVVAIQKTDVITGFLKRVGGELLLLGVLLAAPILLLGRWLSRRLAEPVVEMTRVVTRVADTNRLDLRVPVASDDEIGVLARAFNVMTGKLEIAARERDKFVHELETLNRTLEGKVADRTEALEAAVRAQQRLMRDISHEIKSPLARLGMAAGLLRRANENPLAERHLARIEGEIENISALSSELLTLMALDSQQELVSTALVDMAALVRQIIADALYEAPDRRDDIRLDLPDEPMEIAGDDRLLKRAIENVVRNALFYTQAQTPIHVVVEYFDDTRARIAISDLGPGVAEEDLEKLFDPFYRVDEARTRGTGGSGIGLAICRRVVGLHGGVIGASANVPHGLIVEMLLPTPREEGRCS